MDSETQEIIDYFLTESRESVAEVEPLLIELESEGGQPDRDTIDMIFRLFHSMKGSAGFLEFGHVEAVTHHAETLLDNVRNGKCAFTADVVDLLCRALDFTNEALDTIEATQADEEMAGSATVMVERLRMAVEGDDGAEEHAPAAEPIAEPVVQPIAEPVSSEPDPPGTVAVFDQVFDPVKGGAHDTDGPAAELPLEPTSTDLLGQILVEGGHINAEQLANALSDKRLPVGQKLVQMDAVDSRTVRTALSVRQERREGEKAEMPKPEPKSKRRQGAGRRRAEYLRVDVRKLDQLMDLIGELIIAETAVTHGPGASTEIDSTQKAAVQLNRVTRGLQDVAMSLRMVPIDPTFKKMKRLVRDLSKRQGKKVDLVISGADTEVDKSVVEAISDPLVHLIRNAIDHGIESSEDRIAAGKPGVGTVRLSAQQQAGEIRIHVKDDGKGLDRSRILRKGIERGLVKGDGSDLSDSEVFRLIFEPGFSTAAAVTDISGRGVGMDVVKQNIEAVKGRVDIQSTLGVGTTLTLRIPLTLAIIEGMLVRVGQTRFTIPMLSILETVVVEANAVTRLTNGQEVARVRGQLLPVFRVHQFYGIEPDTEAIHDGLLVVVEDGNDRLCMLVDELVGQRQTVIKALSGYLGNVRGLAGCTVLGDGSISLIIDVAKLIQDTRAAA